MRLEALMNAFQFSVNSPSLYGHSPISSETEKPETGHTRGIRECSQSHFCFAKQTVIPIYYNN